MKAEADRRWKSKRFHINRLITQLKILITDLELAVKINCFAISELSFDLSVYDIFGMLAEGGTIVLPRPKERKMADRWFDIVINEQITIWNSVPAIYDMFLMVAENSTKTVPLKKVLLSGDWVQPTLYDRNKKNNK